MTVNSVGTLHVPRRGSLGRRLRTARVDEVLGGIAAVITLVLASLGWNLAAVAGLTLITAVMLALTVRRVVPTISTFAIGRAVLVMVAASASAELWGAACLLLLGLVAEAVCARILRAQAPLASNLPGCRLSEPRRLGGAPAQLSSFVAIALVAWLGLAGAPWWATAIAAAALVVVAVLAVLGLMRIRERRFDASRMRAALDALEPEFVVHWDAQPSTAYQLRMWLPYLEALGRPYFVIARNPDSYPEAVATTSRPVVYRPELEDLEDVVLPSLRAAFYVNNATRNVHLIRFIGMRHVQLNHGESDKAPSYNPSLRAYDLNFVAGQAAVDRFAAHGIATNDDFFRIVGRPQAAEIASADGVDTAPPKVAMYAPTWAGFHADSAYSSLAAGEMIVTALLARDLTVVFRPHPHTDLDPALREHANRVRDLLEEDRRTTGRDHLVGRRPERELSLAECFNAADLLITDVSSVAADFLASGKPFAVSQMMSGPESASGPPEAALVSGGYPFGPTPTGLATVLDTMAADPLREDRLRLRTYVLGPSGPDAVDAFTSAALQALEPRR
ncbi:CDP-glycerol glycerophosphotransferase family protein [Agromyces sp. Leaf222]|uniref:CDP-glycerol glycerophosphotransferase family protein n=1 Tax=Agromyces sp. Leaf222 TaxID=1735688 RepID=UPI000700FC92|nr:CDP-glycerol glycerophosphotransferase family protein [Agromyces sp. Leaf222]KQM84128.1 hypothetical protein ASE68_13720 [Agromyces sp. Leaf222]